VGFLLTTELSGGNGVSQVEALAEKKEDVMNSIEQAAEQLQTDLLAIARQSIDDKNQRVLELEGRIQSLEAFIARLAAGSRQVQPQQVPTARPVAPRRWSVR
jgi:hypothetical protein